MPSTFPFLMLTVCWRLSIIRMSAYRAPSSTAMFRARDVRSFMRVDSTLAANYANHANVRAIRVIRGSNLVGLKVRRYLHLPRLEGCLDVALHRFGRFGLAMDEKRLLRRLLETA